MTLNAAARARLMEMDAEDRAVNYLATLPHQLAKITAIKAAHVLAQRWEIEAAEMLRRNDPRLVYHQTDEENLWLAANVAAHADDGLWQSCPVENLHKLFADLPPDAAAFVAYTVARWICWQDKLR